MTTPFGPQLIGETEKTLSAILERALAGHGITERQWVTLRLARQQASGSGRQHLVEVVADRAHFADAGRLVEDLEGRDLLVDGALSPAGTGLVAEIQAAVAERTAGIWDGLGEEDVAATTRVLNEVVRRARVALTG